MRMCAMCVIRVGGCAGVSIYAGTPHYPHCIFQPFVPFALPIVACSGCSINRHRIVCTSSSLERSSSQPFNISNLWRPRYNSSRTSSPSFCDGHRLCISSCCARAMSPISCERTHILKRGCKDAPKWAGRYEFTPNSSGPQNRPCSHGYTNSEGITGVKQHQCFQSWSLSQPRCLCVLMCMCSLHHELFRSALNLDDHIYLFPRTSTAHTPKYFFFIEHARLWTSSDGGSI